MELTMQERKKLTMVMAPAYLKAGKAKKSVMLEEFCASTGYCRRHAPLCGDLTTHGISHTRSTPLGGRIPLQTCMDPPLDIPGALAVDLVGHDGGQAVGDFGWTLTVTDCTTGWTEAGAVRTKAEIYVVAALESCLHRYPGQVISLHADNGSEFMNGHLTRFCHAQGITFTRSRPYHKNDNAHVEEKNNSVVRKFVGYDRHDCQEEVDLLNRLYQSLHLLVNWFLPSQKLLHKERTGSHVTKVYDRAQTPCARMLARRDVPEETKKQLQSTCAELDLTSLHHEISLCQDRLDAIAKRRQPLVIKKRASYGYISREFTT
jgi:hypothetical protein